MTATEHRQGCGTYLAFLLHHARGEQPCSECLQAEDARLTGLGVIPGRLLRYDPVTPDEAARNRAVLAGVLRERSCRCPARDRATGRFLPKAAAA